MSAKSREAEEDRVPSYEESIASGPSRISQRAVGSQKSAPSFQQRIQELRQRRIASILLDHLNPAIVRNLEDANNDMTLVLLASDSFPDHARMTSTSIISPALSKPTTLIRLSGDDFKSSFLSSWTVLQDLSDALVRSMVDPSNLPQLRAQLPDLTVADNHGLPDRPLQRSWLKRTFGMPGADHDPTGQTGRWNLGWKSEENRALTSRTITTNELVVTAKLSDVTVRTESALGLLESTTVSCVWLDVLVRA